MLKKQDIYEVFPVFEILADRRYDRGADELHPANTPVVSPETQKPKALTSGSKMDLLPVHTTMAQYQIYTKYMPISSFLQYLADNLLPFVVNVIAKHNVATVSPAPYTG